MLSQRGAAAEALEATERARAGAQIDVLPPRAGRHAVDTPAGRIPVEAHPSVWARLVLLGRP